MKALLKCWVNLVEDLLLLALAVDILYLYYTGSWYEPIRAVELAELVILWTIIPFALWRFIKHIKEGKHEQSH